MTLIPLYAICNCGSLAYASDEDIIVELSIRLPDLKELDKRIQEYDILKDLVTKQNQTIAELENALALEKRDNDLNKREIALKDQLLDLKDRELAAKDKAFQDMKEVADRAIKLAEVSKPGNSVWTTIGLILGGVVAGLALAAAF